VVERRSKKGRTFYGCANYPNCDFISWDAVATQRCPDCNSYAVIKRSRGGGTRIECAADKNHHIEQAAEKETVEV
jgi:DNA topoisomerase-1